MQGISVIVLNCVIIISSIVLLTASDKSIVNNKNYESDIPNEKDLHKYLNSINKNVRSLYTFTKGDTFKINIIFGLFLMNVNLKHALYEKGDRLNYKTKVLMEEIINHGDKIIEFYKVISSVLVNSENPVQRRIATVFEDDDIWLKRLKKFHVAPPAKNSIRLSRNFFRRWSSSNEYINKTLSYLDGMGQKPVQSDFCIASIAENKYGDFSKNPECLIDMDCFENIVNGTDYGYFLAHRIVQLVVADLGVGCTIVSRKMDAVLIEALCTQAFAESEYIATNGFKNADLLLEFIALCSMSGQSQFIRLSWLEKLLSLQTPYGWFEIPCAIRRLAGLKRSTKRRMPKKKRKKITRLKKLYFIKDMTKLRSSLIKGSKTGEIPIDTLKLQWLSENKKPPFMSEDSKPIKELPLWSKGSKRVKDRTSFTENSKTVVELPDWSEGSNTVGDGTSFTENSMTVDELPYGSEGSTVGDETSFTEHSKRVNEVPFLSEGSDTIEDWPFTSELSEQVQSEQKTPFRSEHHRKKTIEELPMPSEAARKVLLQKKRLYKILNKKKLSDNFFDKNGNMYKNPYKRLENMVSRTERSISADEIDEYNAIETLKEQSQIIEKMQRNNEEIRDIMHESAVAAAAFAAATRFIIEMYY